MEKKGSAWTIREEYGNIRDDRADPPDSLQRRPTPRKLDAIPGVAKRDESLDGVAELRDTVTDLRAQLAASEQELARELAERAEETAHLEKARAELVELRQKVAESGPSDARAAVERRAAEAEVRIRKLEQELEKVSAEVEPLQTKLVAMERELLAEKSRANEASANASKALEQSVAELQEKLLTTTKQLDESHGKFESVTQERDALAKGRTAWMIERRGLEEELTKLRSVAEESSKGLRELEPLRAKLEDSLTALASEKKAHESALVACKEFEERLTERDSLLSVRNEETQKAKADHEAALAGLAEAVKALEDERKEAAELAKKATEEREILLSQVAGLESRAELAQTNRAKLEDELKEAKDALDRASALQGQAEEAKNSLAKSEAALEELQTRFGKAASERDELASKNGELMSERDAARASLASAMAQSEKQIQAILTLRRAVERVERVELELAELRNDAMNASEAFSKFGSDDSSSVVIEVSADD